MFTFLSITFILFSILLPISILVFVRVLGRISFGSINPLPNLEGVYALFKIG